MEHLLFSELIKNQKVKPDFFITKKIDEIDFPLKHVDSLKKNINFLMYESFTALVEIQKIIINSEVDIEIPYGTEKEFTIVLDDQVFQIKAIKNKKECPPFKFLFNLEFDDSILTKEFIGEINKRYVLFSLVFAVSFEESLKFIKTNPDLNSRFLINEIISFWTNNFKNDFCYLNLTEIEKDNVYNEREIEFCIMQFYFNYYKNLIIDDSKYSGDQLKVLNRIVEDKSSYKWYLICGIAIWNKIREKFKNNNESLREGLLRFKEIDYDFMDKMLNSFMS